MVVVGVIMALDYQAVYPFVVLFLGLTMMLAGLRSFIYYFTMARHMVGGRIVLYRAIIVIDMALFTLTLTDVPPVFVVLYLAGIHGFAGFVDILRARESKRLQGGSWKLIFVHGLVNVIIAALCLAFIGTESVAAGIYSLGLAYSGIIRIVQAFRRTAVVYIQ